ncbi:hypothetical protein ONZ45_g11384 [Pleurotus djamor]|nr:hypothetical protein ONZ45_g11384 [Pleurotus djamor]
MAPLILSGFHTTGDFKFPYPPPFLIIVYTYRLLYIPANLYGMCTPTHLLAHSRQRPIPIPTQALFTQADADAHRVIDEELRKYKALIRALCARRNTHIAISKLPNEIISRVFIEFKKTLDGDLDMKAPRHTKNTKNTSDYLVRLLIVAGVCSRWRQVALDTATLWSTLLLDRPAWVAGTFKRSKQAPLTVLGPLWRLTSHESDKTPANMLSTNTDAAPRFQHVDIRVMLFDMYSSDTPGLLFRSRVEDQAVQAPLLRTLSINYTRSIEDCVNRSNGGGNHHHSVFPPKMMPFPFSEPTSLQSLTLRNLVPVAVPSMPSLTHLCIQLDYLENIHLLSLPRVLDVLRNVPVVESVSLSTVSSDESVVLAPPNLASQLVRLPYLRELNISPRYIKESIIFAYLDAPSLRKTVISFLNEGDDPRIQSIDADLSYLNRQITRSIPSDMKNLSVSICMGLCDFDVPYRCCRFDLTVVDQDDSDVRNAQFMVQLGIPGDPLNVQCRDIFQSLPFECITKLAVMGADGDEEALAWASIVTQLVRLRFLDVGDFRMLPILGMPPELPSLHDVSVNPPDEDAQGEREGERQLRNNVNNPELETIEMDQVGLESLRECEIIRSVCCFRHGQQRPLKTLRLDHFVGAGRKEFDQELLAYGTKMEWVESRRLNDD